MEVGKTSCRHWMLPSLSRATAVVAACVAVITVRYVLLQQSVTRAQRKVARPLHDGLHSGRTYACQHGRKCVEGRDSNATALLFMMRTTNQSLCTSIGGRLVGGRSCKLPCNAPAAVPAPPPWATALHSEDEMSWPTLQWLPETSIAFAGNQSWDQRAEQLGHCGARPVLCGFAAPSVRAAPSAVVRDCIALRWACIEVRPACNMCSDRLLTQRADRYARRQRAAEQWC